MPNPKSDRAGVAQLVRRHREGRHREPRAGCPLCFPEAEPDGTGLAGWATNAVDQVVRAPGRSRPRGTR